MAIREVLQIGDPRMKAENGTVKFDSEKTKQIIQDLVDTMRAKELIGMAAPQIGENYQIYVTEPRPTKTRTGDQVDELRVYINPTIIAKSSDKFDIYEGCGSVVNGQLFGPVERSKQITVQAIDRDGKKFRLECDGILARVIQHEQDHLECIEFTEKISNYSKLVSLDHYLNNIKESDSQILGSQINLKKIVYM